MMQEVMLALSSGFLVTIKLFVLTLLGSLPLGLLIAFTSMSSAFQNGCLDCQRNASFATIDCNLLWSGFDVWK